MTCMTGEGWRYTMVDCKVSPPYCTKQPGADDCGFPIGATFYFVSFQIICTYIVTNLFIALILDAISSGLFRERAIVSSGHLAQYQVSC